ncbi:long-chain fatty acid--CoA ligase [Prolixibacteraceae bacterium JC049]|nr:long-chain fatty acid--CoA ligase [Prolixibacteraceae bacterium JC049]
MNNKLDRLFDLLPYLEQNFQKEVILAGKSTGTWKSYSTKEYVQKCQHFSIGLLKLGLEKEDKIITVCNSRPEWNVIDMGIAQAGMVHVPLYPNLTEDEYAYLIEHSEAKLAIIGNKVIYNRIKPALERFADVKVYTVDEIENEANFSEIVESGEKASEEDLQKLNALSASILPDDLVTIIYTSGTTGAPKGVMLSHKNILSNAIDSSACIPLNSNHKVISFLPLCHVYERMLNYLYLYCGIPIYYAQNMGTIVKDLNEIKADGFTCVPRFLEKVYDQIVAKGKDLTGFKKSMFFWSIKLAEQYVPFERKSWWYNLQLKIARKLIFSKWQAALGGNVKMIVSGGAAMQERLGRIFGAAGLLVQEGYGLTETSPVNAVNGYSKEEYMLGTVGPVLNGVTVKIAEDGEILVKGPNVMKGYYKDPEYTSQVIDNDGWFHTGDIGMLVDNKFLKITDRKKSIFKLSSGKYVAPQVVENKAKESNFIEQAMVVGENEKYTGLVISPNFDYLHFWATKHNVVYRDNEELVKHPEVKKRIQKEIIQINKGLSAHEQMKTFVVVAHEWTPNTGELSASLKLKRDVVFGKYATEIEEMFQ